MANQFLSLALFIMLLSFFIILNSMASYDEDKANPVINSLSVAFSSREIEKNIAQSTIPELEQSVNEGSAMDRMKALFKSNVSGFKSQENRFGTEMYATLPLAEFENAMLSISRAGTEPLNGEAEKFLPMLVSILKSEDTALPYRIDILLNTSENPAVLQNREPEKLQSLIRKSAMFGNILEQAGLPKKLVSAGLNQGDESYVSLAFRPYAPYSPLPKKQNGGR